MMGAAVVLPQPSRTVDTAGTTTQKHERRCVFRPRREAPVYGEDVDGENNCKPTGFIYLRLYDGVLCHSSLALLEIC